MRERTLPNTINVSVDTVVYEDHREVGFRMISQDSDGILIKTKALWHPHLVTTILVEAMMIKEDVSWIDRAQ